MADDSVRALIRAASARLTEAGVPSPRVDAELLMAHVLGVPRSQLSSQAHPTPELAAEFRGLIDRRCLREPLQHLIGEAYFRYLTLAVGPGVFIPRPETETLVDIALAELASIRRTAPGGTSVVVDLCTGSAVIPLAMATEHRRVRATAVELSEPALVWARRNIADCADELADAESSCELVAGDARKAAELLPALVGEVDVLTCNPPYIPDDAIPRDPEVRDHDPALALYGGRDGLDIVRDVVDQAALLLKPGSLLLIEHGDEQGDAGGTTGVPTVVRANERFTDVRDHHDLAARPRVTTARRR